MRHRKGRSEGERRAALSRAAERRVLVRVAGGEFTADDIGDRDGWKCRICHTPVDRLASVPDLLAPTVDHVTPLSRGGKHSLANVQLAHFICNAEKGDALPVELSTLIAAGRLRRLRNS